MFYFATFFFVRSMKYKINMEEELEKKFEEVNKVNIATILCIS